MLILGILPIIAAIVLFITGLNWLGIILAIVGVAIILFSGFRTVRPIERGVIERFGKYTRTKDARSKFIFAAINTISRISTINITINRLVSSWDLSAVAAFIPKANRFRKIAVIIKMISVRVFYWSSDIICLCTCSSIGSPSKLY
ncbi:unnamed protein product [marine sediment metagenome]|uniref:Uncharacterized protein n=1 Tax=marine sediment metagenome TaxID=412755 RepID=X1LZE9_9ZZZZ